jgi:hypothetical protein
MVVTCGARDWKFATFLATPEPLAKRKLSGATKRRIEYIEMKRRSRSLGQFAMQD